jgi:hypothetical protein
LNAFPQVTLEMAAISNKLSYGAVDRER